MLESAGSGTTGPDTEEHEVCSPTRSEGSRENGAKKVMKKVKGIFKPNLKLSTAPPSISMATTPADLLNGLTGRPSGLPPKSRNEALLHAKQIAALNAGAKKAAESERRRRREEEEQEKNTCRQITVWEQDIFPNWEGANGSKRARKLWMEGVPEKVRAALWQRAIGNKLQITPDLYNIFRIRGAAAREALKDKNRSITEEAEAEQAALESIDIDLPRTFPSFQFFQEGPLRDAMASILQAYVQYRPDVGYVQGMSYIVAMMLLHMNPEDVFVSLANLLHHSHLLSFFRVIPQEIGISLRVYDLTFCEVLPSLYGHFSAIGLHPQFYVYDWFITIFSKSLPIDVACNIWDLFLLHPSWLFKSAIGLLLHFHKELAEASFDACFHLLTHLPKDLDGTGLIGTIKSIKLNKKKFESIQKKASSMDNSCFIPMA